MPPPSLINQFNILCILYRKVQTKQERGKCVTRGPPQLCRCFWIGIEPATFTQSLRLPLASLVLPLASFLVFFLLKLRLTAIFFSTSSILASVVSYSFS